VEGVRHRCAVQRPMKGELAQIQGSSVVTSQHVLLIREPNAPAAQCSERTRGAPGHVLFVQRVEAERHSVRYTCWANTTHREQADIPAGTYTARNTCAVSSDAICNGSGTNQLTPTFVRNTSADGGVLPPSSCVVLQVVEACWPPTPCPHNFCPALSPGGS
jgi:hypothetical protein